MKKRILAALAAAFLGFGASYAQKHGDELTTYNMMRAFEAIQNNDPEEATAFIKTELNDNPKNGYAYYFLAISQVGQEQIAEAITAANKALQYIPKKDKSMQAAVHQLLGNTYNNLGDADQALAHFAKAMALEPADEDHIYSHINVYEDQERYAEQWPDIQVLIKKFADNSTANVYVGRYYHNIKQYDDALRYYSKAARIAPDYSSPYAFRAHVFMDQHKWLEAADDIVKALSLDSDDKAWDEMIMMADSAYNEINKSLTLKAAEEKDNPYWPHCLGIVNRKAEHYETAVDYFTKSLAINADSLRSYVETNSFGRALCYEQLARYDEALRDLSTALEYDDNDARYYLQRANVYYQLDRLDDAIADITRLVELVPQIPEPYLYRAGYYMWNGEYKKALDDLDMAAVMDPDNLDVRQRRATTCIMMGRRADAEIDLQTILAAEATDKSAYNNKAFAHATLGHRAEALDYAMREYKDDDDGDVYNLACIYSILGDADNAVATLEKAFELGFRHKVHAAHDCDFANIRGDERYRQLLIKQGVTPVNP